MRYGADVSGSNLLANLGLAVGGNLVGGVEQRMNSARSAELQGLLEGVALPASKAQLVAYARTQDANAAGELARLPDREYRTLDEVGEELVPVQPHSASQPERPHEESDLPPGGDAYLDPNPVTGAVRDDAPPHNPPQKAIDEQSKTLKKQQAKQQEKLDG